MELKKRVLIVMNEGHHLLPQQEAIIDDLYSDIKEREFLLAPKTGWTLAEMMDIVSKIKNASNLKGPNGYSLQYIVFVSPIPYLLRELTRAEIQLGEERKAYNSGIHVRVFHNDRREKKTLPDGRVVHTVAQTGWVLV